LLGSIDNANPGSKVYEYVFKDLNFTAGTAKLLGANGTMPITVPTFNLACGGGACINQPGVTDRLDALGDRLMYRLALFNDGTTQHFLVTHSVNNSSAASGDYPSLYLSGQTAGEPSGTTDTESLIFQSSGSQTDTFSRWGDYSSMVLDGADSCSFWYTTEYYPATASFAWNTRIAKIRFSSCP
jgi:hypothetical protein